MENKVKETIEFLLNSNTINNYPSLKMKLREKLDEMNEKEKNKKYITNRPIQVGDLVHKVVRVRESNKNRVGRVIKTLCGQCVVIWEFTKTPIYEFNDELKILKLEDKPKPKKQFVVLVFGMVTAPIFYDSYEEAEEEAKRLLLTGNKTVHIMKTFSTLEQGEIKIKKTR